MKLLNYKKVNNTNWITPKIIKSCHNLKFLYRLSKNFNDTYSNSLYREAIASHIKLLKKTKLEYNEKIIKIPIIKSKILWNLLIRIG